MAQQAGSRYGFIDAIRGVAACLVMLGHSLYFSHLLSPKLDGFIPQVIELGEVGVVAFFLVSGFVIPLSLEKTDDARLFWLHRILRIYPLYIAIYIVTFLVKGGGPVHTAADLIVNAGAHLVMLQEPLHQENFVEGSWTLVLEMAWYISMTALFLVSLNKKTNIVVAAVVIGSVLAEIVCQFFVRLPLGRLSMLICCVIGFLCYRRDRNDISPRRFAVLTGVLVAAILGNLIVGFLLNPSTNPTAPTFKAVADSWAIAAVVFFVPFLTRQSAVWRHPVFAYLGKISYSIYLVHMVVLHVLSLTPLSGVGLVVATFVVTLGISTLSYHFIEWPPIRFGHSLRPKAVLAE